MNGRCPMICLQNQQRMEKFKEENEATKRIRAEEKARVRRASPCFCRPESCGSEG